MILPLIKSTSITLNGQYSLSGDIKMAPISCPKALDTPSKYNFHESSLVDSSSIWKMAKRSSFGNSNFIGSYSSSVWSARNSLMALPLIAF